MEIQGISISQIITVGIFLAGLVFLQIFITKNKNKFSSKWKKNKRIELIEEKSLSATEKLRIISVDNSEFLIISNKGNKSSLISLKTFSNKSKKRVLPNSTVSNYTKPELNSNFKNLTTNNAKKPITRSEHDLSKAIQLARQMNPDVSFK
tara:strand:+ start:79 stop:528 length:450 start_codon:yes stop_codon:yes gene_type:complete